MTPGGPEFGSRRSAGAARTAFMSGEMEGVGDFATGASLAHAIDREAPGGDREKGLCLNCGTARIGAYCHHCGQSGHVHRSIGAIWHDLLHGVLHLEGKFWRTLPLLAWRPGELMRRYVDGERARFVSPMAMFLFSVFSLFAILSILGIAPPAEVGGSNAAQAQAAIGNERADVAKRRDRAIRTRDDVEATPEARRQAGSDIAEYDRELAAIDAVTPIFQSGGDRTSWIKTGWARLDYGIEKAEKNPGLALYKLQANSYKFSWLLIPLSIPFVWIMFAWRRQFRAYDHAVFVTYSIAFMSLLFILLTVMGAIGVPIAIIATIGAFVPPIHIYRQLRDGYRLRRWSALARMLVLVLLSIHIIAALFLTIVLGLGLVG